MRFRCSGQEAHAVSCRSSDCALSVVSLVCESSLWVAVLWAANISRTSCSTTLVVSVDLQENILEADGGMNEEVRLYNTSSRYIGVKWVFVSKCRFM